MLNWESGNMLSFIVPIYNAEKTLYKCLSSIQKQKYRNIEVLMIDDGSTDGSAAICLKFQDDDKRFRYLYQTNSGVSNARNYGIREANGTYLTFVDSDDYVDSYYGALLVGKLIETNSDACFCYSVNWFENGTIENDPQYEFYDGKVFSIETKNYNWRDPTIRRFTVWGGVYRKDIVKNIVFDNTLSIGEDTYWIAEYLCSTKRITYIKDRLYYYLIREGSAYHTNFSDKRYDEVLAWHRIYELYGGKANVTESYYVTLCEVYNRYHNDKNFDIKYVYDIEKRFQILKPKLLQAYCKDKKWRALISLFLWNIKFTINKKRVCNQNENRNTHINIK